MKFRKFLLEVKIVYSWDFDLRSTVILRHVHYDLFEMFDIREY